VLPGCLRAAAAGDRQLRVKGGHVKFDRAFLFAFNGLARLFGVFANLVGVYVLMCAYAFAENRALYICAGIFAITIGVAFLLAKPFTAEQLSRLRRRTGMGRPD
jgi:hypothetical protein